MEDDGTLVLVRKSIPTFPVGPGTPIGRAARVLNDDQTIMYLPFLTRPWIMCKHATPKPHAT